MIREELDPGTQIVYIPLHAGGDINHPDVELGFVTSSSGKDFHFCRYWRKGVLGVLRTTANSEATPNDTLVERRSVNQALVEATLKEIEREIPPCREDALSPGVW